MMSTACGKKIAYTGTALAVLFWTLFFSPGVWAQEAVTFNQDIAPILFGNCATCHRAGQSAPFALTNYTQAKQHASDIAQVTQSRFMPPWPPADPFGKFKGDKRLEAAQIKLIKSWVDAGSPEGGGAPPALPNFPEKWQGGEPDLVLAMPKVYELAALGANLYRSFVLPVPITEDKHIRAVEVLPNSKALHHAFIKVDRTRAARSLDGKDGNPGFPGMLAPDSVKTPEGHFVSWQPGRSPSFSAPGAGWTLEAGSDLVAELHLVPSGKVEPIQISLGLYFTPEKPSQKVFKIGLTTRVIEIPAGQKDFKVTDEFTLPVDLKAASILPHAHLLAEKIHVKARFPSGRELNLLRINQWDFDWQSDYQYTDPPALPKGTVIVAEIYYNNSSNNPNNPNHPPKPVHFGLETTDEMAEVWIQCLVQTDAELTLLKEAFNKDWTQMLSTRTDFELNKDANNPSANLDKAFFYLGQKQTSLAEANIQRAITQISSGKRPGSETLLPRAYYLQGLLHRVQGKQAAARESFEKTLQHDNAYPKAHGNLGLIALEENQPEKAESYFKQALLLDNQDAISLDSLAIIYAGQGKIREAHALLKRAAKFAPNDKVILQHLEAIEAELKK